MNEAELRLDLLDKNELTVVGIELDDGDLGAVAATAADVLGLRRDEVLVTDVRPSVVTFDILRPQLFPHQVLGRSGPLLDRLRELPGVALAPDAEVTSRGMLGWIAADAEELAASLREGEALAAAVFDRVSRRVAVFATGAELVAGHVHDENTATIIGALAEDGFTGEAAGTLPDDVDLIAGAIRAAIGRGFGLVVTTGGVGAEDKDRTVEAVEQLDPGACTPYLCHFEPGHGRHRKDGVRIAVGSFGGALIVSLPGPNDEVRRALPVLRAGLRSGATPPALAGALAEELRTILRERMGHVPGG